MSLLDYARNLCAAERRHHSELCGIALRLGLSLDDVKRARLTIRDLSGGAHPIDSDDLESMLMWRIRHGGKLWALTNEGPVA